MDFKHFFNFIVQSVQKQRWRNSVDQAATVKEDEQTDPKQHLFIPFPVTAGPTEFLQRFVFCTRSQHLKSLVILFLIYQLSVVIIKMFH